LLSQNQIKHFKLTDLPETVIVVAHVNQLVRDVSQGMTLLKNKYDKAIPTNITTLKIKSDSGEEKSTPELYTSAKNIYLLLQDF
jgi:L-lactate utilization protein LutC